MKDGIGIDITYLNYRGYHIELRNSNKGRVSLLLFPKIAGNIEVTRRIHYTLTG